MVAVERQQDFLDRIRVLEQRVRQLENAAPLKNASISEGGLVVDGGNITVKNGSIYIEGLGRIDVQNGGSLLLKDTQGRNVMYVGGFDSGGFGLAVYRSTGGSALTIADEDADPNTETPQRFRVQDRNAKKLLVEDSQGDGSEWPMAPILFGRTDYTTWASTDSASFVELVDGRAYRHARRAFVRVRHTTDAADTTGELRLMLGGTQVGSTLTVGFALASQLFGPFTLPGVVGDGLDFAVEARRTAGTGRVRVEVVEAWQSGMF